MRKCPLYQGGGGRHPFVTGRGSALLCQVGERKGCLLVPGEGSGKTPFCAMRGEQRPFVPGGGAAPFCAWKDRGRRPFVPEEEEASFCAMMGEGKAPLEPEEEGEGRAPFSARREGKAPLF